jgi:hypothetical protein
MGLVERPNSKDFSKQHNTNKNKEDDTCTTSALQVRNTKAHWDRAHML